MATSRSFIKYLKSTCEKGFLLYLLVEILQLVHKVSSFREVLYKRGVLKNFPKFKDKHKKQSSAGVLSKDVHNNFAKFIEKHICRSLFFYKVALWKPELSEAATGDAL